MRLNVLTSFCGFVILIAALYCPLLRPFHLFNMDAFSANKPYGMVLLLVAVVGIIGTVFNQVKITRFTAYLSLGLVVLFYIAAFLKVHASFSFIPFRSIDAFLTRQIKFKWGWYLMFAGPLLAVAGVLFERKRNFIPASGKKQTVCKTCGGKGSADKVTNTILGQLQTTSICPACKGKGSGTLSNPAQTEQTKV